MKTIFVFLLSTISISTFAQVDSVVVVPREETPITLAEDSLKELVKTMMTNQDVDARTSAADSFVEGFFETLEKPESFDYSFDSLRNVSQLYPQDSTFRIMTWQLYIDKDEYKYFGIIQHKGDSKKGLSPKVTLLEDYSGRMRRVEEKILSANNWYGALYYNIKSFKTKEGVKYALFGYDAYRFFEKRKLMEILSFDKEREPVFGAPVIEYVIKKKDTPPQELVYNRFLLQYSSEASVSINFKDDEGIILFDHLIPMSSTFPDVPYVMVPDGSYEGFKFKKGMWQYVEKVYSHALEDGQAPRPAPVFNDKSKGKDILGRDKK